MMWHGSPARRSVAEGADAGAAVEHQLDVPRDFPHAAGLPESPVVERKDVRRDPIFSWTYSNVPKNLAGVLPWSFAMNTLIRQMRPDLATQFT